MFTPALRALRDNFPVAQIDVLITDKPVAGEVLAEGRTVNKIIRFPWKKKSILEKLKLIFALRKNKYDWSITTSWTNPFKGSFLAFLAGAKKRVGTYKKWKSPFYTNHIPGKESRPRRETNLDLVRVLGVKIEKMPESFFEFEERDRDFARNFLESIDAKDKIVIGFHPGAEIVHRYLLWPKEYFVGLGKKILENYSDAILLLFSGPGEKDICQEIKGRFGEKVFLASDLSLKQVAALIDECKVFVASDSGLNQIAGATKTSLISIFGPSESRLFAPAGPRVKVFQAACPHPYQNRVHGCLKTIASEMVFKEIQKICKSVP